MLASCDETHTHKKSGCYLCVLINLPAVIPNVERAHFSFSVSRINRKTRQGSGGRQRYLTHDKQARTPCLLRETRARGDPANRAGNEGSAVCPRSLHPAPGAGPGGPHGAGESRGALSRRTAARGRTPRSDARPPRGPPPPRLTCRC